MPLGALALWIAFLGAALWLQHARWSQQPPAYDAWGYYLKAHHFWAKVHAGQPFNPFNVEPGFRPPGTVAVSYPFGFDVDYRGFYFRSIFVPIALIALATVVAGYRREMESRSKRHLVAIAAFLSTLPCFYYFELAPGIPAPHYWGLVDFFLAGVSALAAACAVRSVRARSVAWAGLSALLAAFCLSIKPAGLLIMMLVGAGWFFAAALELRSVWAAPSERRTTVHWLVRGTVAFAVVYALVTGAALASEYLSAKNLAYGSVIVGVLQSETKEFVSWPVFREVVRTGLGYPFAAWLLVMAVLVARWISRPVQAGPWSRASLAGLALGACATLAVGGWFWIVATGGITQIRYFVPFVLVAVMLALPVVLAAIEALPRWAATAVSLLLLAPVVNMAILLPQQDAPVRWQQWTGVSMTSGASIPVFGQAWDFAAAVKRDGRNATLYSMSMNYADAAFQSVVLNALIATPPMPGVTIQRPQDGVRLVIAFRKEEMLGADYWLFEPVRDPDVARAALAAPSIDTYEQERALFHAWATQLTERDGVTIVSDTPAARVLKIVDPVKLEAAFDALVAGHRWRSTFVEANPKRRVGEAELAAALARHPPGLENVNFSDRFHVRALSVSRAGDDTTVRVWWKPLSPVNERDWSLFIHTIDDQGKILLATHLPIGFDRPLASLGDAVLFDEITFRNPGAKRLAIGFYRPDQPLPPADKGTRDWDNRRVIVPVP